MGALRSEVSSRLQCGTASGRASSYAVSPISVVTSPGPCLQLFESPQSLCSAFPLSRPARVCTPGGLGAKPEPVTWGFKVRCTLTSNGRLVLAFTFS